MCDHRVASFRVRVPRPSLPSVLWRAWRVASWVSEGTVSSQLRKVHDFRVRVWNPMLMVHLDLKMTMAGRVMSRGNLNNAHEPAFANPTFMMCDAMHNDLMPTLTSQASRSCCSRTAVHELLFTNCCSRTAPHKHYFSFEHRLGHPWWFGGGQPLVQVLLLKGWTSPK